jgi:glutathione S-transferase
MEPVVVVTVLALIVYMYFSFNVGLSRAKYGVEAPAVSGHPEWERMFRVQQNTVEQLIIFLPAIWLCGSFANPMLAAGLGLVFVVGRLLYGAAYVKEPSTRTIGFLTGFLANVAMLLSGLGGAVLELL